MPSQHFHTQNLNGIPFRLKTHFNLDFVAHYGQVFKAFDGQESGNLCFGVQQGDSRYFVKFAGAPTIAYEGKAEDAIEHLKASVPVYRDLAHPNLVKLIQSEPVGGGYACIFEWEPAECLGRRYPVSREKFLRMSMETRMQAFEDVLTFHLYVVDSGYVAIDLYDGSIMYDFNSRRTILCDIDVYAKRPYTNHMGRMWGSTRFMSPEEFQLGETIDEVTNVYTMGAVAYALFANFDRSIEAWPLGRARYEVIAKAVSDDRQKRQQSLRQLIVEWQNS